jgi:hypothetical protein
MPVSSGEYSLSRKRFSRFQNAFQFWETVKILANWR